MCTEEVIGAGKDIFEGVLQFAVSEAREKFYRTDLSVQREEDQSAYPYTQEHQKLEGKMKHDSIGEWLGIDQGVIGE